MQHLSLVGRGRLQFGQGGKSGRRAIVSLDLAVTLAIPVDDGEPAIGTGFIENGEQRSTALFVQPAVEVAFPLLSSSLAGVRASVVSSRARPGISVAPFLRQWLGDIFLGGLLSLRAAPPLAGESPFVWAVQLGGGAAF